MRVKPHMRWRWNHTLMVVACLPIWVIVWHYVGGVIYYVWIGGR
mgnify:CR=1 FL=1